MAYNYPTKASMVRAILDTRGELDKVREEIKAKYPHGPRKFRELDHYIEHHPLFRKNKRAQLLEIYEREVPDIDLDEIVIEFYD